MAHRCEAASTAFPLYTKIHWFRSRVAAGKTSENANGLPTSVRRCALGLPADTATIFGTHWLLRPELGHWSTRLRVIPLTPRRSVVDTVAGNQGFAQ